MEWVLAGLAWLYGRYLAGLPPWVVLAGATTLGVLIGGLAFHAVMSRAIDIHVEKQSKQVAAVATPAHEPGSPASIGASPSPLPRQPRADEQPAEPSQPNAGTSAQRLNSPPLVSVSAPGGVVSVNQQGGITANTVIVGSQATYRLEMMSANLRHGNRFRTEFRIRLNTDATIGELRIGIFGKHVLDADVHPYDAQGPMQIQFGRGPGVEDDLYVVTIQNAYRGYTLVVFTAKPEELRVQVAQA